MQSSKKNYTKEDIMNLVEEEDVEFIRLQFTDMFGCLKNMAIMQWNGALWLQYMHKGIREDCVNEQQDLVNRIYEQNKPIPLRIEIKKFTASRFYHGCT